MSQKFSLALVGSLLVIFSFTSAGRARADWVIDTSGTLVEIDALALTGSEATIALIAEVDASDATLTAEQEAQKRKEEAYNRYQSFLAEYSARYGSDEPPTPEDRKSRREQFDQAREELIAKRDAAKADYEARQAEWEKRREQTRKELETRRQEMISKKEAAQERFQQAAKARKQALISRKQSIKSRLELRENQLEVVQETLDSEGTVIKTKKTPLPPREKIRLEKPERPDKPLIISASTDNSPVLEIETTEIKTRTEHPLSIGENNELIVTRPDGTEKTVTVLPDQAAEKIRQKGFTREGDRAELKVESDQPVYRFQTNRFKRLFGLFRTKFSQNVSVSAETGEVVTTISSESSPFRRFLERFSF